MVRGERRKDARAGRTRTNRTAGEARTDERVPVNGGEASPELDQARQMARMREAEPIQKPRSPTRRRTRH